MAEQLDENAVKNDLSMDEEVDVDSLLETVNGEYIANRKKSKIIVFSMILAFTLALSLIIIIMSCIKVDLRPSFVDKGSSYIATISNNNVFAVDNNDEEKYDKFNDLYLNSFSSQYLTALFTGRLGGYKINETANSFSESNIKSSLTENYVKVTYDKPKTLYRSNGQLYYSIYSGNKPMTFTEMYFTLSSENVEKDHDFFLAGICEGQSSARVVKITIKANTYNLYKFITE